MHAILVLVALLGCLLSGALILDTIAIRPETAIQQILLAVRLLTGVVVGAAGGLALCAMEVNSSIGELVGQGKTEAERRKLIYDETVAARNALERMSAKP